MSYMIMGIEDSEDGPAEIFFYNPDDPMYRQFNDDRGKGFATREEAELVCARLRKWDVVNKCDRTKRCRLLILECADNGDLAVIDHDTAWNETMLPGYQRLRPEQPPPEQKFRRAVLDPPSNVTKFPNRR